MDPGQLEELQKLGLFDPTAGDAADQEALLQFLVSRGVSVAEMVEANAEQRLPFVLGDRVIRPGQRDLTIEQVADRVGAPVDQIRRLWRALGLPEREGGARQFSEDDVRSLQLLNAVAAYMGEAATIQLARVIGSSLARVAETGFTLGLANVEGGFLQRAESLVAAAEAVELLGVMTQIAPGIFDVVFRHHIETVVRRWDKSGTEDPATITMAIGFADLVGFTPISHDLTAAELAEAVTDLESIAVDAIATGNGRLVKLIGDEVMFGAPSPAAGCAIALDLLDAAAAHPRLPPPRASLAVGSVVPFEGDYYGPVVNLASRLVDQAAGGELLVTADVAAALDADRFEGGPSQSLRLKGFADPVAARSVTRA